MPTHRQALCSQEGARRGWDVSKECPKRATQCTQPCRCLQKGGEGRLVAAEINFCGLRTERRGVQRSQPEMVKDARSVKSLEEEALRTATPQGAFPNLPRGQEPSPGSPFPWSSPVPSPPLWPPSCQAALATPTPT